MGGVSLCVRRQLVVDITETQQRVGAAAAVDRPDKQQQAAPSLRVCVPGNGCAHMYGVPSFVSAPGGADDGAFCAECRAETQRMKTLLLLLLLGEEEVEKEEEEGREAGEEG